MFIGICSRSQVSVYGTIGHLVFSSPEPKAHNCGLIVYQSVRRQSGVRPASVVHNSKIFSETAWPIKLKFYVEHPWIGGMKVCSRDLDHMTKMTATPTDGKNHSKICFSRTGEPIPTKLGTSSPSQFAQMMTLG